MYPQKIWEKQVKQLENTLELINQRIDELEGCE